MPEIVIAPIRDRRHETYDRGVGEDICDLLADGFTPEQICDGQEGRPARQSTLKHWLKANPDFQKAYDSAWVFRVECMAREIVAIADDDKADFKEKEAKGDAPAQLVFDRQNVVRTKVRIEHRWKMLGTEFPARYGWAVRGGAAPMQPGDDAKLIEANSIKDEVVVITKDALRDEAISWSKK